ncbi:hypothetical protein OH76DRAFT_96984 [Lentinus brumalis]|uniref:Uncharacterized protein n=1 Tax=Lentinus brumalis TaxID=2498619 RepID=A0A371CQJ2_9APHY|nr:hypothetical protein OH76DRAFT_96984 [Polyporus brumalis]
MLTQCNPYSVVPLSTFQGLCAYGGRKTTRTQHSQILIADNSSSLQCTSIAVRRGLRLSKAQRARRCTKVASHRSQAANVTERPLLLAPQDFLSLTPLGTRSVSGSSPALGEHLPPHNSSIEADATLNCFRVRPSGLNAQTVKSVTAREVLSKSRWHSAPLSAHGPCNVQGSF